jgi:hypothetical protein
MAGKVRKPVPKNQREISTGLHQPFDTALGNPNDGITPLPHFVDQTNPATRNTFRAQQISEKGDTTKGITIGIQDIDESILYYFNNVIRPFSVQNGERIAVPVIYGAPERWASVQKNGYFRDKNEKIMAPLIMFKRASMEKNLNIGNKLDANNPQNYIVTQQGFQKSNAYSRFDLLNNRKPIKTYSATVVPDYVTLTYSCIIWTYYVEQMNKIVEAVNYASDSYWGDPARFKFNASIASFTNSQTLNQGEERLVKTDFTITMRGYIVPDIISKDTSALKKFFSKGKVLIQTETVEDIFGVVTPAESKIVNETRIDAEERPSIDPPAGTTYQEPDFRPPVALRTVPEEFGLAFSSAFGRAPLV